MLTRPVILTPEQYLQRLRELVVSRQGELLTQAWPGARGDVRLRCAKGHTWLSQPRYVERGIWCAICRSDRMAEMRGLAEAWGGSCLSKNYSDRYTPLRWQCASGHTWETRPANIRKGQWCPKCAILARTGSIEDMKRLAAERGGECLSSRYVNADSKLRWRCSEGHVWRAKPAPVQNGTWCPACAGKRPHTLKDMHRLAKRRGGECLSRRYVNAVTPLHWRCAMGHEWISAPGNLLHRDAWCPTCGYLLWGMLRRGKLIAESHGGVIISERMNRPDEFLLWRCKKRHQFRRKLQSVLDGKWCPKC